MKNILIIGEETKAQLVQQKLSNQDFNIELSDGDMDEDFKDYDIIFDLNFDDDSENFPIYAKLKDRLIFLSSVKQSLSESAYIYPEKVRSQLFGLNSIPYYLSSAYWEISAYRGKEWSKAEEFLNSTSQAFLPVDDRVGMYRPRVDLLMLNERIRAYEQGVIQNQRIQNELIEDFKTIDQIGVTEMFETLMAIYDDTKEMRFLPAQTLKKKYLRNHQFIEKK